MRQEEFDNLKCIFSVEAVGSYRYYTLDIKLSAYWLSMKTENILPPCRVRDQPDKETQAKNFLQRYPTSNIMILVGRLPIDYRTPIAIVIHNPALVYTKVHLVVDHKPLSLT